MDGLQVLYSFDLAGYVVQWRGHMLGLYDTYTKARDWADTWRR